MKHYLYALGAIFCWASLPAATGSGLDGLTIEELLFYSFISAALLLYAVDIAQKRSFHLYFPDVKRSLVGIWGIFLYHYLYYQALDRAPVAEAAILATTWSFWIVVFSSVLQERRVRLPVVGIALLGLGGAALVISAGQEIHLSSRALPGYLIALLCGLIWSSFSVTLSVIKMKKDPMTTFTAYAAVLATLCFILTGPHSRPPLSALLAAVYLGCVPLGLSFYLWNRAVVGGNMAVIGMLSYLTPPLAVLLVALVERRTIAPQVLLGMALIILAAMLGKKILTRKAA